jgi:hypothetical protein
MPTNPEVLTLFQVVKRSVEIVDPTDTDPVLGDLLRRFEDDDEPVTALDDLDERVGDALAELDPASNNPAVSMAGAMILYLAHRRDEIGAEPADILRLTARSEWKGDPPDLVRDYLTDRGITV